MPLRRRHHDPVVLCDPMTLVEQTDRMIESTAKTEVLHVWVRMRDVASRKIGFARSQVCGK